MRKFILGLVLLPFAAGVASAAQPLTAVQMDRVVAGGFSTGFPCEPIWLPCEPCPPPPCPPPCLQPIPGMSFHGSVVIGSSHII